MHLSARIHAQAALSAVLSAAVLLLGVSGASASGGGAGIGSGSGSSGSGHSGSGSSGGAGIGAPSGGLDPTPKSNDQTPAPAPSKPKLAHGHWMRNFTITEYWPAPESWFSGRLVSVPGLTTKHRIDWLYSAMGVSMEGEGLGLDGSMYHIDALGNGGWVTQKGASTSGQDGWSGGSPYWRAGEFWRNRSGAVTFPLQAGGWSNGSGRKFVPLPGVTFAPGASLPLHFYQSIAVDPRVIPMGSRVYVPAYAHDGHGGWFVAQDTGGAILGHHIDVYRNPPPSSNTSGNFMTGQKMYVVRPA